MSILISPTLANLSTPYYAIAGGAGSGVTEIVAGANIAVNQATGAVTVSATGLVPTVSSVTYVASSWGSAPYPSSAIAGQVAGQTYVPARSGVYLCQVNMGFNIGPSAVVAGVGDLVNVGLVTGEPFFLVLGAATLQPLNMPNTGSDYGLKSLFLVTLNAGQTYNLSWWVNNTSTTLALGETNGGPLVNFVPLC